MSVILAALKKAERKLQAGSSNGTAGEGANPWKKAWETIADRASQQAVMPDAPAADMGITVDGWITTATRNRRD
jgi:hypothetical protein